MTRINEKNLSTSVLIVCAIVSTIILGAQVIAWATTACQVPNPNEKFCTSSQTVLPCSGVTGGETFCTLNFDALERNKFPDGGGKSSAGTTTEEPAACWCRHYCVWDAENEKCNSCEDCCGPDDPNWQPEDKTVEGDNECPTDEG